MADIYEVEILPPIEEPIEAEIVDNKKDPIEVEVQNSQPISSSFKWLVTWTNGKKQLATIYGKLEDLQ